MKPLTDLLPARLREAWQALAAHERQLASAAVVALGLVLAYVLLWAPLQTDLARLRSSVPEERAQLAWMRAQAEQLRALGPRTAARSGTGDAVSAIEQSATARGIRAQISHIEADGAKSAQIVLEAVSFNTLIAWLVELQDNHGLLVDNATLDAHATPGTVNARIRLRNDAS
jgi:general secretion pathway protein M